MGFWSTVAGAALGGPAGAMLGAIGGKERWLGEDPADVVLPPQLEEAQAARSKLIEAYQAEMADAGQDSPLVQSIRAGGERAQQRLGAEQMGMARGVRGLGSVGAMRQAMANTAAGRVGIAGKMEDAVAREKARQKEAARLGLLQALGQHEAAALGAEQYRRETASPGLLPAVFGAGGGLIGGKFGGPEGAMAGAQLGYGLGGSIGQQYR